MQQLSRGHPRTNFAPRGRAANGMCMGHLHPWGPAGSVFLPMPVPNTSPGWWHGSQQARHGYAEAKGHFSELSAAAHLCVSLGALRHGDQVPRKQRDPPAASKSAPETSCIEMFLQSSSKMLIVIRVRKRSLWLQVGPKDTAHLVEAVG